MELMVLEDPSSEAWPEDVSAILGALSEIVFGGEGCSTNEAHSRDALGQSAPVPTEPPIACKTAADLLAQLTSASIDYSPTKLAACSGRLLALLGVFLGGSIVSDPGEPITDRRPITAGSFPRSPCSREDEIKAETALRQAVIEDMHSGQGSESSRQVSANTARELAEKCLRTLLPKLCQERRDLEMSTRNPLLAATLDRWLPELVSALRVELPRAEPKAKNGVQDNDSTPSYGLPGSANRRRPLAVLLSLHWTLTNVHYTAVKERLGICLPPLLHALDCSVDACVRLVGFATLRLLLDRAMAAEVQNLAPPLEHCLGTCGPLFLDGDDACLCSQTVAPFCAASVLFIGKAFGPNDMVRQQDAFDKLLNFGQLHCRTRASAFLAFMETGLVPVLRQQPQLLAVRLKSLVETLLQAAEAADAREVLVAWRALYLLLEGELRSRLQFYAMDIVLRAAFTYLSFGVSQAPEHLFENEGPADCEGSFRSPVVAAMTASEWQLVCDLRVEILQALGWVMDLMASHPQGLGCLEQHLLELEDGLTTVGGADSAASSKMVPQLKRFTAFARGVGRSSAHELQTPTLEVNPQICVKSF